MTKQWRYTEESIDYLPFIQRCYLIAVLDLLADTFEDDHKRVALWMNTANPLLGQATPAWFIYMDRGHKLYSFVVSCREGNL